MMMKTRLQLKKVKLDEYKSIQDMLLLLNKTQMDKVLLDSNVPFDLQPFSGFSNTLESKGKKDI